MSNADFTTLLGQENAKVAQLVKLSGIRPEQEASSRVRWVERSDAHRCSEPRAALTEGNTCSPPGRVRLD
jgi:hypothetical protein